MKNIAYVDTHLVASIIIININITRFAHFIIIIIIIIIIIL